MLLPSLFYPKKTPPSERGRGGLRRGKEEKRMALENKRGADSAKKPPQLRQARETSKIDHSLYVK